MQSLFLCMTAIVVLATTLLAAGSEIDNILLIKDNDGADQVLHFGLDLAATDTLDAKLGENELPPFPPTGVFEARFVGEDISLPQLGQGTYKDFRQGHIASADTVTHELKYQPGSGEKIIILWELPENTSGLLQDLFGGVVVNKEMKEQDSLIVDNPGAINKLKMMIYYSGLPLAPGLLSPPDSATNISLDSMLTWTSSAGAEIYRLQISESSDFTAIEVEHSGPDTSFQISGLKNSATYFWRVSAQNVNGAGAWSDVRQFTTAHETSIRKNDTALDLQYELLQNYPNPFNNETIIEYQLAEESMVRVEIFNVLGRRVRILVHKTQLPGYYKVKWDGRDDNGKTVAGRTYFYRIQAADYDATRKLLLLK